MGHTIDARDRLRIACAVLATACGGGGEPSGPPADDVATVVVSPSAATLTSIGATTQLTASARNASGSPVSGKTFTWTSTSGSVATVSASGVVTATGPGSATLRATVSGGSVSGTAQVTVEQAVAALTLAPSSTTLAVGGTLQLTASATDAGGAPIANPGLTWSSSAVAVASVNGSGLVTGVAPGTTTITVMGGGVSAQRSLTVTLPGLTIAKDTTISGTISVEGFSVASGFTVTVNGPLTLHSSRLVSIAGTLSGNCQAFDIVSDTAVTISGTVSNGCGAGLAGKSMRIASTGEFVLDGALIESSGAITLTNNPALGALVRPVALPFANVAGGAGIASALIGNSTIRFAGTGMGSLPAPPGTSGPNGTAGTDGAPVLLVFNGNVAFTGQTVVQGQDGGAGGNGTNAQAANVTVNGGSGGAGGQVLVSVGGTLTYSGTQNFVASGSGGHGGSATATSLPVLGGTQAPSATATAGHGGNPGLPLVQAGGGLFIEQQGALVLIVGNTGNGGDANAQAADGMNATVATAAQLGGNATANAGDGGETPDATLVVPSTPTGFPVLLSGLNAGPVNGGTGGTATAHAGNGGNGSETSRTGAGGGTATANGGDGGSAMLAALGSGGDGGDALFEGGNGGDGWNGCVAPPATSGAGGAGGRGGDANGSAGSAGSGKLGNGIDASLRFSGSSNGGDGGDGAGPGAAGAAGTLNAAGATQYLGITFSAGSAGAPCPPPPPLTPNAAPAGEHYYMQMSSTWGQNQLGVIGPGPRTRFLLSTPTNSPVGTVTITTAGGNPTPPFYVGANPDRIGQWGANFWDLNVASVMEGATFPNIEFFTLCFLNESPAPSPADPIFVVQRDNFGVVWDSDNITGPGGPIADGRAGCHTYPLHLNATHVRWWRNTGATSEVDWITFRKKLTP